MKSNDYHKKKHRKEPSNKHVQQWGKYLKTDEDLRLTTEYTHNVQVKILKAMYDCTLT